MGACPACAFEGVVLAHGDEDSKILFIGSVPGDDEIRYHRPFVGDVGRIFRKELMKIAHIDLPTTRQVLLWWHPVPTAKKRGDCLRVSLEQVYAEMANKDVVILVGADAVRHFTSLSVDDVNGFDVTSEVEWNQEGIAENLRVFALANPTGIYRNLGEIRFGLEKLAEFMGEQNETK